MSCNSVINDELKNIEETTCPFYDDRMHNLLHHYREYTSCHRSNIMTLY